VIAATIEIGKYYTKLAVHSSEAVQGMGRIKTVILDDKHFTASALSNSNRITWRVAGLVEEASEVYFDSDQ